MWALRIRADDAFDLNYDTAGSLGLEPHHLVAEDYGPCQDLAERLRADPALPQMIRVPSAALPGTPNIVIFGPRVSAPYLVDPLGPVDVPASLVADRARPPDALFPLVRFQGTAHAEFEAWTKGEPFDFAEPAFPA